MRASVLAAAAAAVAILSGTPAKAETWYPWCAYYSWSTYNCGFVSQRQCLATAIGSGAQCRPNPNPPSRRYQPRSEIPADPAAPTLPTARVGEPPRMIQLSNGRWVSSWSCVIDEGYGRFADCNTSHPD
jgi:hypothetical protein